ncbi:hypothetical protein GGX14DRAFT_480516 [Mycena pura]|uniref:Uncharacterized protein n=1 Tax=Mycena pura TaxID=153505 RepID=A0AAD6UU35_9AGAR|nr:hypothetical protein GGX14DRAFT_480516 [Mycena pura]
MPWVKRADGTWGNVVVEAPPPSDSEEDAHTKSAAPQSNLVAARAAQFQSQKASPAASTPLPSISKKKPVPPAERTTPAPPPYTPAFPPRRTAAAPSRDNDDAELDKGAPFEPKPLRPRAISNNTSLPAPRAPAALSTEEYSEDDTADVGLTGIRRPPPPLPRMPSRPSLVPSQTLPLVPQLSQSTPSLPSRQPQAAPPLPSRQSSQSTPPLQSRQPHAQAAPPLPSRHSAQSTSEPPLPSQRPQSTPPLPPRYTASAPPLPSRSTASLVDVDDDEPVSRRAATRNTASLADDDDEPATRRRATRNTALRPPPTRAKSCSASDRQPAIPRWSASKSGFAKGKAAELARNRRDCLHPPPACFARAPPARSAAGERGIQITYARLAAPVILRSPNSNDLAKALTTGRAFPAKPPPLGSHDVQREDWNRLWDDIDETARIEMRTSAGLSVATLPLMPIVGAGFAVSTVAERKLRARRVGPTCKLVEEWNVNFFRPRHLDAIDPAFLKFQQATDDAEKQRALKEYEKYKDKFRFVVQSWPLEE